MPDIFHDFPIRAAASRVYEAVSTPAGLDRWWTLTSSGTAAVGSTFELGFGAGYDWRAVVRVASAPSHFELEMTDADADWSGSKVAFRLDETDGVTQVRFSHTGWAEANAHWRTSTFCWAMYLRVLRRALEFGEDVPYEQRLDV